jgi:hypothetical protein
LLYYEIKRNDSDPVQLNEDDFSEFYYSNSILKFISDLFSSNQTQNSTSIFYSNDFNVLIDIIIRKLANLSANDQVNININIFDNENK